MTRSLVLAIALALLPACGGGGGSSSTPAPSFNIMRVVPKPLDDGWMDSANSGRLNNKVGVGDEENIPNTSPSRLLYRFRLDGLTAGTVTAVTLQLHQTQVDGAPYQSLGNLQVVRVDFGTDLDPSDYHAAPLGAPILLSSDASIGSREVDVTTDVQAAIAAGRDVVDFRVQWSKSDADQDGNADIVCLSFADDFDQSGLLPGLFVRIDAP